MNHPKEYTVSSYMNHLPWLECHIACLDDAEDFDKPADMEV